MYTGLIQEGKMEIPIQVDCFRAGDSGALAVESAP